jgi:Tol biopolymer transport system component
MRRLLLALGSAAVVLPAAYGAFEPRLPAPEAQLGPRIAFDDDSHDVWVVRADGSQRRRLTSDPAPKFDPTWSPKGSKLAYRSEVDGNAEIYVLNADGSGKRNLTRNPAEDYSPAWSPGGKRIAFASSRSGVLNDIYVMNADGSHIRRVTRHVSADEYPTWSPNG